MRVNTERYEGVHGRKPRGRGFWIFNANGVYIEAMGTYSDAKRVAMSEARKMEGITEITVMP